MKSYFIFFVLLILSVTVSGQNIISNLKVDENSRHADAFLSFSYTSQRLQQTIDFPFTSIALKSKTITDFRDFAIINNEDTIYFTNDAHDSEESDFNYSSLVHFDNEISNLNLLYPEGVEGVHVVLMNGRDESASGGLNDRRMQDNINNCELPNMIPQSEWRSGLNPPNYSRTFTTTQNMIVHHSAGSNTATNYTQVVRDIYIFHTQERNWSDIGYNYLVAPDGRLYAGRDPGDGEQDKVMGAHFCGGNGGTMGVCLLGNYDLQDASEATYETLEQLLTWKGFTDELNVQSQNPHPLNENLGVIAGHRNGCSTQCPGNFVYARLPEIRSDVAAAISVCAGEDEDEDDEEPIDEEPVVELPVDEDSLHRFSIYPNPVGNNYELNVVINEEDRESLKNLYVFDAYGRKVKWEKLAYQSNLITLYLPKNLKTGMYFLYVVRENTSFHRKFILL